MDAVELLLLAVFMTGLISYAVYDVSRREKVRVARLAAWSAFAERMGLHYSPEQREVTGEYQGVPVRLRMEQRDVGRGEKEERMVLSAKVPAPLPDGFVAAPRKWTGPLSRALADNLFKAGDVALDDCLLFQSDRMKEGQWLLGEADVRDALRELFGPRAVGFVERGVVAVAWKEHPENPEHLPRALDAVVRAVAVLQGASGRALQAGVWLTD